ncbi:MAG: hemerythrin domain-containing protein [Kiloniellales bacterium]|nr:hemerythrin domain-containing protein [Kiloniellales bacterium]
MRKTDSFRQQHATIVGVVTEFRGLLDPDKVLDNIPDIMGVMIALSGKLKAHLAKEDNELYPELLGSGDPKLAEMAAAFQNEMGGLSAAFESYMETWRSIEAIEDEPESFIRASEEILDALSDRINRENRELYALADRL